MSIGRTSRSSQKGPSVCMVPRRRRRRTAMIFMGGLLRRGARHPGWAGWRQAGGVRARWFDADNVDGRRTSDASTSWPAYGRINCGHRDGPFATLFGGINEVLDSGPTPHVLQTALLTARPRPFPLVIPVLVTGIGAARGRQSGTCAAIGPRDERGDDGVKARQPPSSA